MSQSALRRISHLSNLGLHHDAFQTRPCAFRRRRIAHVGVRRWACRLCRRLSAGRRRDTWGGYPEARARLVRTIADLKLSNVVVASGDAHIHAVGTVPLRDDEPDGPAAAVEFLATSIASGGDGAAETEGAKAMLVGSPHMKLVNAQRGYQTFDVTPREWRTDVKVLDRIQRPGGALSTLASFAVEPGRPVLE
nr:alkaline phosphatase D family protein [uncultured Brevundimonas sp.]